MKSMLPSLLGPSALVPQVPAHVLGRSLSHKQPVLRPWQLNMRVCSMATATYEAATLQEARPSKPRTPRGSRKAEKAKQPASKQLPKRVSVMPGVGPKYEQLMQAHNIRTVSDLMQLHVERHGKQMEVTQKFLKEVVGITKGSSLKSIAQYLETKQQELESGQQQQQGQGSLLQPKVTLSVEGNISAGKSTFLKILEGKGLLDTQLQVVPEPVDKWQAVGDAKVNLLMEFYKAPERFAYTFQNYVFLTRMMQERESYTAAAMCRLLERSVFSDKMVFVRSVHAAKYMSDTELEIYNSWFDPVLSTLPTLVPNGFIYLRARPETCHSRLKKRAREEESSVKLEYLQDLHLKHEDWLYEGGDPVQYSGNSTAPPGYLWVQPTQQLLTSSRSAPSQSAAGSLLRPGDRFSIHNHLPTPTTTSHQLVAATALPSVPHELDRAVRFLDTSRGAHMHPLLHTVPALVLDCDQDVDVERDEEYKAHIAQQVTLYCDYVRQYMLARGQAMTQLDSALMNASSDPQAAGYNVQVNGSTLYLDHRAPLLAFASDASRRATATLQLDPSSIVLPGGAAVDPLTQAFTQHAARVQGQQGGDRSGQARATAAASAGKVQRVLQATH